MHSISVNTRFVDGKGDLDIWERNGYGYATVEMVKALQTLGYEVTFNDPKADVGICFDQPHHSKWYGDQYKIQFTPWESTVIPDEWRDIMNSVDEVWTPSPLVADWFVADGIKSNGLKTPVYVYEHGVDTETWKPVKRKITGPTRMLHAGGEAVRKGVTDVMKARRMAFGDSDDVELHLKIISETWNIPWFPHVFVHNKEYPLNELVDIFNSCHVYVYPSYGEGFGLTPLQAMATGMPTICTAAWAPYKRFLHPDLALGSRLLPSPKPQIHPGYVTIPNFEELVEAMKKVHENYDMYHEHALEQVPKIKEEYNWVTLTEDVFKKLEKRLQNS